MALLSGAVILAYRDLLPALLISPWAVVPVVVISGLPANGGDVWINVLVGSLMAVAFAVPVAYLGIFCVGLPVFLLCRRFARRATLPIFLTAIFVPFVVFYCLSRLNEAAAASLCGLAVAATAPSLLPERYRPSRERPR